MAVVGGINMDIAGYASGEVVPHDSNPGRVEHTAGGVGRNEAHSMRLLGLDVKLVTAFGDDLYAEKLRQNCRDLGIDVKDAITVVNAATSTYLSVVDHRGDPVVGISSMDIYDYLTPALLAQRMGVINRAHTCVVDTNLTEDALRFLADNCRVPLFAETISVAKAHKLRGILDRIDTLKADRLEVQLLLGREPDEKADVAETASQLLNRGGQTCLHHSLVGSVLCGRDRFLAASRLSGGGRQQDGRAGQFYGRARVGADARDGPSGIRLRGAGGSQHLHSGGTGRQ